MKKLVITGVSSFIGYHLASKLSSYYDVIGTITSAPESYTGIRKKRIDSLLNKNIQLKNLSLTNLKDLRSFILHEKPQYWINHAGYTKDYTNNNYNLSIAEEIHIAPLQTIFESLNEVGCQSFIGTGTVSEYSDNGLLHHESEECLPALPYGQAKLKQTIKTLELGKKFEIPTAIIRVSIPYGEYDDPNKLFPTIESKLFQGQKVDLSPGTQIRNFIHIDELIYLYFAVFKINKGHEIFNGASTRNISVKEFILNFADKQNLNKELLQFGAIPMREGETQVCRISPEKNQSILSALHKNQLFIVENQDDLSNLKSDNPLILSTSPKLTRQLKNKGYFVFESENYFFPKDHLNLSKKTNLLLKELERSLDNQLSSESLFNVIFHSQFIIAKNLFKESITQNILLTFPLVLSTTSPIRQISANCFFRKLTIYIKSIFLNLAIRFLPFEDSFFISSLHRLLPEYIKTKNPNGEISLVMCSFNQDKFIQKLFFNYCNFLPKSLRKKIFNYFFNYPFCYVVDLAFWQNTFKEKEVTVNIEDPVNKNEITSHVIPKINKLINAAYSFNYNFNFLNPKELYCDANTDLSRELMPIFHNHQKKIELISHGSHAINSLTSIEDDLIRHAKGLILSDYGISKAQSRLAYDFLCKYSSHKNYELVEPILWGKKVKKNNSIKEIHSIPKDAKVLLHASTPKSHFFRRFVLYETPGEYLRNLKDIIESISGFSNLFLIIKFRPNADLSAEDILTLIGNNKNIVIDQKTPFLECLYETDALISYSSTTMEEALAYNVKVIQYTNFQNFSFLPITTAPLANKYTLQQILHDTLFVQ